MFEIEAPVTRRGICDDLKVIHEGPHSVIEAAYDLTACVLEAVWELIWLRARRLNLLRAHQAARAAMDLHELVQMLDDEEDPARAHLAACLLALSLPQWVYAELGEGLRTEILGVIDYTGWAID